MLRTNTVNTWEAVKASDSRRGCGSIRALFRVSVYGPGTLASPGTF